MKKVVFKIQDMLQIRPSKFGESFKQGIYITSPFLDKEGVKELSFDESVAYYGAEHVNAFMRTALNI